MKRPDTPFPRHWLYYIAIKIVVIARTPTMRGWAAIAW